MRKNGVSKGKVAQDQRVCFYTVSNDGYIEYAIKTLRSVKKHNKGALFVLGHNLSKASVALLKQNDIAYVDTDLEKIFYRTWEYPSICYYVFAGPEIFCKRGFSHSVYIDCDVLCQGKIEDYMIRATETFSGISPGTIEKIFGYASKDDAGKIKKAWPNALGKMENARIHSGAVIFNNDRMKKDKLLKRIGELFHKAIEIGAPRKGDDSLFSLYQYVYGSERDLVWPQNTFCQIAGAPSYGKVILGGPTFIHFCETKPWEKTRHQCVEDRIAHDLWNGKDIGKKQLPEKTGSALLGHGHKKRLIARRPIKLFWSYYEAPGKPLPNFGDMMTREIIIRLFKRKVKWAPIEKCKMIGIGSIMEYVTRTKHRQKILVWGSGYMKPGERNSDGRLKIYAVRGKYTAARLGKKGVVLGDPGLLANLLYDDVGKKPGLIGFVPHYIDFNLPIVQKIKKDSRFVVIDPLEDVERVVKNIAGCRLVVSSSLHGLIVADSFGIPCMHISLSDKVCGGSYKFEDYYSATGREYRAADIGKIFDSTYHNQITMQYEPVKELKNIQKNLIKSFPL